jgi:hypothetical protein
MTPTHHARGLLALGLLLTACKDKVEPVVLPDCGIGAIELGVQGQFTHQTFDTLFDWRGLTGVSEGEPLVFAVGHDTTSLAVTVEMEGENTGLALLQLDDDVFIDVTESDGSATGWYSEPYYHWAEPSGTIAMPITPGTAVHEGCLSITPAALDDLSGETGLLHVISRRFDPVAPIVDLNLVIVGDTEISDADLDVAVARMDEVWSGGGGPHLGVVTRYQIDDDETPRYNQSDRIRSSFSEGNPQAINLFFIQDFSDEVGTLGVAGGLPGPLGIVGIDGSGVMLTVDGHTRFNGSLNTEMLGETMAHEVGHQMGLFHTTEADGTTLESLEDTPDCPRNADDDGDGWYMAEECVDYDGTNFMFWVAGREPQGDVSASQAMVIRQSVVTREGEEE